jgi:hypothetical protein
MSFFIEVMAQVYGLPVSPEVEQAFAQLADALAGEFAAAGEVSVEGVRLVQLARADSARAMAANQAILGGWLGSGAREVNVGPIKMRVEYSPGAASHDGIRFDRFVSEVVAPPVAVTPGMSKTDLLFAGWDDVLGGVMDGGDVAALVGPAGARAPAWSYRPRSSDTSTTRGPARRASSTTSGSVSCSARRSGSRSSLASKWPES